MRNREEAEAGRQKDLIQKERFRRRMEEEVKIEEMNMGMKTKDFKFSNIFGIRLKLKSIKFK